MEILFEKLIGNEGKFLIIPDPSPGINVSLTEIVEIPILFKDKVVVVLR